jgi:hypothetical protein
MNIPDIQMDGDLAAGIAVPESLETMAIEGDARYEVASVNGKRLLIDTETNTVVDVLN